MKTLLESLKQTVIDLRTGAKHYSWTNALHCNCGILAQTILQVTPEKLSDMYYKGIDGDLWGGKCQSTNAPLHEVFSKLFASGLSKQDIYNLENLTDKTILANVKMPYSFGRVCSQRSDKDFFIHYLETWIQMIERGEWQSAKDGEAATEEVKIEELQEVKETPPMVIYKVVRVSMPEFEPNLN